MDVGGASPNVPPLPPSGQLSTYSWKVRYVDPPVLRYAQLWGLYSTVSMVICIGVIASSFIGGTIVNVAGSYLAMFAFIGAALVLACVLLALAIRLKP